MNANPTTAYMIGIVCAVAFFLLALLSAVMIAYRPDLKDKTTRKVWYWVLGIICAFTAFLVPYFAIYTDIKVPSKADAFMNAMIIGTCLSFVIYVIAGFIVSKSFKTKKVQSWFN